MVIIKEHCSSKSASVPRNLLCVFQANFLSKRQKATDERLSPGRRGTHNGLRASSLRPFKEFANREEDTDKRARRKGRNKHNSSRNHNCRLYSGMYIFIIFIFL